MTGSYSTFWNRARINSEFERTFESCYLPSGISQRKPLAYTVPDTWVTDESSSSSSGCSRGCCWKARKGRTSSSSGMQRHSKRSAWALVTFRSELHLNLAAEMAQTADTHTGSCCPAALPPLRWHARIVYAYTCTEYTRHYECTHVTYHACNPRVYYYGHGRILHQPESAEPFCTHRLQMADLC